jgi:hypothetical protein
MELGLSFMTNVKSDRQARAIAFYLPQFHPIPENDVWWGTGFTEWTNVAKAKPLFRGHYQPHVPADLGFYDLRVPEVRKAQADMAEAYGIEGFCYWHYWFGGKRLLERPFEEVLRSKEPDFPFCLAWANESWTGIWHGESNRILVEQTYPGEEDYRRHFDFLLSAFSDDRYIRVDGKPLLFIYKPVQIPNCRQAMDLLRNLASIAGLPGLHLVCFAPDASWSGKEHGFDAVTNFPHSKWQQIKPCLVRSWAARACRRVPLLCKTGLVRGWPQNVVNYSDALEFMQMPKPIADEYYPCVVPNWDNSPRSGTRGWILHKSSPELFRRHLREAKERIGDLPQDRRIIFVKSWNEWAEGNHLEPDLKFGHKYLQVALEELGVQGVACKASLGVPELSRC